MATVLLVDDDECILRLCAAVLVGLPGVNLLEAASGRQAIDVAFNYQATIHLLVSDIIMPGGISGTELAESLEVSRPDMKVLLMSGHCAGEFAIKPTWEFLAKPFRPSDLLDKVAILTTGSVVAT